VPIPPRAVPEPPAAKAVSKFVPRILQTRQLVAPVVIPKKIAPADQLASAPDIGVPGAVVGTDAANGLSIIGAIGSAPTRPPSAPEPKAKSPTQPVHFRSVVAEANLISRVVPVYPPLAKSARIQGAVEFTALISKDGRIENLQLVHGHPLLVKAAREAVEQWKYRPTLLNGVPVEVITDIIVNFTLNQ
jgi:protein TonB